MEKRKRKELKNSGRFAIGLPFGKMTRLATQLWKRSSTSPQSGRQSLTPGEASAASETLGSRSLKNRAHENGGHLPRAALRFTSFRFDCPGLNSVAGDAGSVSAFGYRQIHFSVILVLIVCLCFGCNRGNGGGISSGPGTLPSSSGTAVTAQVSSSAEVVKVTTDAVHAAAGSSAEAVVRLAITSGYHVNANPATYSYLIATEVKPGNSEGINVGTPNYPSATKQKFEFAEEPLAVYEGNIELKLPLKINATITPGERSLPITVRVQACDTEKCFPPATINATIPLEVK